MIRGSFMTGLRGWLGRSFDVGIQGGVEWFVFPLRGFGEMVSLGRNN